MLSGNCQVASCEVTDFLQFDNIRVAILPYDRSVSDDETGVRRFRQGCSSVREGETAMKRAIILLLVFLLLVPMTGCGGRLASRLKDAATARSEA